MNETNIVAAVLHKVRAANAALIAEGVLPAGIDQSRIAVEPPREAAHGGACGDPQLRARRIADFIAGMTDRYALGEHARLFDSTPELR